jgi:hypothetical protein
VNPWFWEESEESKTRQVSQGRAVQVDPIKITLKAAGWGPRRKPGASSYTLTHLSLSLESGCIQALKPEIRHTTFNFWFQIQLAPLHQGGEENGRRAAHST